ncbi:MAG: sensor histidine kinase [Eisenbergiella sp.]
MLDKIKEVSRGNLKIEPSRLGNDEIGIFDTSFTQMVGQVSQLIENYVMEMKKKDAEFMALQSRSTPTSSLTRWKS